MEGASGLAEAIGAVGLAKVVGLANAVGLAATLEPEEEVGLAGVWLAAATGFPEPDGAAVPQAATIKTRGRTQTFHRIADIITRNAEIQRSLRSWV